MKKETKWIGETKSHRLEVCWEKEINACGGIYMLLFSNGKFYIGKSKNIHNRIMGSNGHFDSLTEEKPLYDAAMNSDSVTVRILKETSDSVDMAFWERIFIHEQAKRILKRVWGNKSKKKIEQAEKLTKFKKTINSYLLNSDLLNW